MSTLYATFINTKAASAVVTELVQGGVRPEDISLVTKQSPNYPRNLELTETSESVGDASYLVGRSDDPEPLLDLRPPFERFSTIEGSPIGGIDTSETSLDVDSVDQADDSQELAEDMMYPRDSISQSEHQRDDLGLAMETGFPTTIPTIDGLKDEQSQLSEDLESQLETIIIPGFGYVIGGGAMATQALDFSNKDEAGAIESLLSHLRSEGVPRWAAERYVQSLMNGGSIVAVTVTPGELDELAIEDIFDKHQGENTRLYDAPRYRQPGYVG